MSADHVTHQIEDTAAQSDHDEHGHESEALGPIDTQAWGAFAVGIVLGLVVAGSIAVSIGGLPA